MNVMITGAAGFIGGTLAEYCSVAGCSVLGLGISDPATAMFWSFEHCDVRDAKRLGRLISSFKPDRIFHLAAQSYPTVSLSKPRETMEVNAGGTINVFECVRAAGIMPVVVVACSSAEYGPVAALIFRSRKIIRCGHCIHTALAKSLRICSQLSILRTTLFRP